MYVHNQVPIATLSLKQGRPGVMTYKTFLEYYTKVKFSAMITGCLIYYSCKFKLCSYVFPNKSYKVLKWQIWKFELHWFSLMMDF